MEAIRRARWVTASPGKHCCMSQGHTVHNAFLILLSIPIWIVGVGLAIYAGTAWAITGRKGQTYQWLISLDQLGNTLAFGNPDETISSRAGRCAKKGGNRPCYWLCRILHLVDNGHCEKNIGT